MINRMESLRKSESPARVWSRWFLVPIRIFGFFISTQSMFIYSITLPPIYRLLHPIGTGTGKGSFWFLSVVVILRKLFSIKSRQKVHKNVARARFWLVQNGVDLVRPCARLPLAFAKRSETAAPLMGFGCDATRHVGMHLVVAKHRGDAVEEENCGTEEVAQSWVERVGSGLLVQKRNGSEKSWLRAEVAQRKSSSENKWLRVIQSIQH